MSPSRKKEQILGLVLLSNERIVFISLPPCVAPTLLRPTLLAAATHSGGCGVQATGVLR